MLNEEDKEVNINVLGDTTVPVLRKFNVIAIAEVEGRYAVNGRKE